MRPSRVAWLAAASLLSGATIVACVDLFHSTADVLTACALDAAACAGDAAPGSAGDAGSAPESLCASSPAEARATAEHACAWLGACESPMGDNAFGSCMVRALLAFDCAANPNHPAAGTTRDLWACLAAAGSCQAVDGCIFPAGVPACPSGPDGISCGSPGDAGTPGNASVRIECGASGQTAARGENCALWGTGCVSDGGTATCAGTGAGLQCDGGTPGVCQGGLRTVLHWCGAGGTDVGIDCADNGAQQCDGFPTDASALWLACAPANASGSCTPSLSVACTDAGVAQSCPLGSPETVDCASLLGSPSACNERPLDPPFDWTSPCALGDAGCPADTCDGSTLTGCARGASFSVDCAASSPGLGECRMITTDLGGAQHAACTPPPAP